mmetsp:Transcript_38527/g.99709  ORF Transcript_38527/g.99709 Transcript_38527/m.99709 type:complete len:203 (-) Transcript_38527:784-1392(-)
MPRTWLKESWTCSAVLAISTARLPCSPLLRSCACRGATRRSRFWRTLSQERARPGLCSRSSPRKPWRAGPAWQTPTVNCSGDTGRRRRRPLERASRSSRPSATSSCRRKATRRWPSPLCRRRPRDPPARQSPRGCSMRKRPWLSSRSWASGSWRPLSRTSSPLGTSRSAGRRMRCRSPSRQWRHSGSCATARVGRPRADRRS